MSERTRNRRRAEAGLTKPVRRHTFDDEFFEKWSEELAWLVGLIWSDGCLQRTTVEICSKDLQMVELAANLMRATGVSTKNGGRAMRVVFSSRRVADRLMSIGLTERKSFTIRWPKIPTMFESGFVRGVLDGDGSIQVRQDRPGQKVPDLSAHFYTASEGFRDDILGWCERSMIRAKARKSHGAVWEVAIREQASLARLHGLLYPREDVCCLLRKRHPFDDWMATPRARPGRPRG